jgi:hypothetical protein
MLHVAVLLAAALPAATVSPARVPARGRAAATLTVERAGMVRLATRGGGGTACTVVDELRGPFQTGGVAGAQDCALDLLLDAGRYRVLLDSGEKAKGEVALSAASFRVDPAPPVLLEPGRAVEGALADGAQASWWIHLDQRGPVTVRVAGRTAGAVHLWRAGAWREPLSPLHLQPEPTAGAPIHEWWVEGLLEAGDYLVTAYGTAPLRYTRGAEDDRVTVQWAFATPADRTARVVLPASGAAAFATDQDGPVTVVLTAAAPRAGRVFLSVHPLDPASGSRLAETQGACQVEPRAPVPECAAFAAGTGRHVVLVRGAPGAAVELRWAPRTDQALMVDGEYRAPELRLPIAALPGDTLLAVHDVPADPDAVPLACALERSPERGGPREVVAFDAPRVGPGQPFRRAFNYDGDARLWFEVTAAGEYTLSAQRATCELVRVSGDPERIGGAGGEAATTPLGTLALGPLASSAPGKACRVDKALAPGVYELRLRGGKPGIEQASVVSRADPGPAGPSPARTGCALRTRIVSGHGYALLATRTGAVAARGVVIRPLPLDLARPLPVEVPAGGVVRLPVTASGLLRVGVPGGNLAGCHLVKGGPGEWRDGACWLRAAGPDELVLQAKPDAPLLAWAARAPAPAAAPAPLRPYEAPPLALPALAEGRAARVDLGPDERKAFVFDVEKAGLHDVGTEGLLATSCALRTPALSSVAEDARGGRGRNCQVQAWLRPGRYLVTVQALAPSTGRAGVVLSRRTARDLAPLAADGETFFRADAGELVRARLSTGEAARFELSAAALGAGLRCRLEDAEGWPLAPVPGPCAATLDLPAGEVVLTQLPLTVESMRRVAVARVRPPVVLEGEEPHPLALWTRYPARLGKDGQDVFTFELPAELDLSILLTNGMQGRVYREGEADALEIVPPQDGGGAGPVGGGDEEAAPEAEPTGDEGPGEEEVAEAEGDAGEGEGEAEPAPEAEAEAPAPPPAAPVAQPAAPLAPEGHVLHLAAGRYRLVTEHSRGDAAIAYEVQLSTDRLAPGVARTIPVPARLPLRVPVDGTLRLRTRGDADVRCRLVDARGRLVAESAEVGEDWNCGLAEPVAAGDYTLVVESETHLAGTARIEVSEPAPSETGPLADGKRYAVGPGVLSAALPAAGADTLLDVGLDGPVACAVDGPDGRVIFRASPPAPCRALVAAAGQALRLRAWTIDRPAEATARLVPRKVSDFGGKLAATAAGRARLARAGRYRTGEGVRCLAGDGPGVLAPCGPEVSLEAGTVLLAGEREVKAALEEVVARLDRPAENVLALEGGRRFVQRQAAGKKAVQLARVEVPAGERTVPACQLEGGVFTAGAGACFAAAGPADEAVLRLAADAPVEARLWRAAVPLGDAAKLAPGMARLEAAAAGSRWELPDGPVRAELLLPPGAWAVLLARGAAQDLCPPAADLQRCLLSSASGGELVVLPATERRLEATVLPLAAPPAPRQLAGVVESVEPLPGTRAFRVPPAPAERAFAVDGATRCTVALDGGGRGTGCEGRVPGGEGALVTVEHGAGPLRAAVGAPGDALARFGRPLPSSGARLAPGGAVRLEGDLVTVSLRAEPPSVLHVRATSGVCALAGGGVTGLGEGCALDLLAGPGERLLAIRGFAGAPLAGAVTLAADRAEPLAEGVGPEGWVGPGQARFFSFEVKTRGKVGLGLQEAAEVLECAVLAGARPLGEGCQQLLELDAGTYLLAVRAPPGAPAMRFRPVVLGLAGAETGVPEDALRELFQRIGVTP